MKAKAFGLHRERAWRDRDSPCRDRVARDCNADVLPLPLRLDCAWATAGRQVESKTSAGCSRLAHARTRGNGSRSRGNRGVSGSVVVS